MFSSTTTERESHPALLLLVRQVLRWSLGGSTLGAEFGSVSALDFASDSTRLLAGFARGQLVEFDLNTGKLLQVDEVFFFPNN